MIDVIDLVLQKVDVLPMLAVRSVVGGTDRVLSAAKILKTLAISYGGFAHTRDQGGLIGGRWRHRLRTRACYRQTKGCSAHHVQSLHHVIGCAEIDASPHPADHRPGDRGRGNCDRDSRRTGRDLWTARVWRFGGDASVRRTSGPIRRTNRQRDSVLPGSLVARAAKQREVLCGFLLGTACVAIDLGLLFPLGG